MAWWNDPGFVEGLAAEQVAAMDLASFPDGLDFARDPGSTLLRKTGACNILQAYYSGGANSEYRKAILNCSWLCLTSPLPGIAQGSKALWTWLLDDAVVCPVFVPAVTRAEPRYLRFDVVMPLHGRVPAPVARAAGLSEACHRDSITHARRAVKALEPDIGDNWRVLAEDGGSGSHDASGSLGLALAAWAAYCYSASTVHEALPALASRFSVSGILMPDGAIKGVGGLESKARLASESRMLLAPRVQAVTAAWVTQANTWQDARARIAPRYTEGERGEFPSCDVLIGFASEQTEPHLKFAAELKPRYGVVILYSDDETRSAGPARRVKSCLETNADAWGGTGVPVVLRPIDARRPHLIEPELIRIIEEWMGKGVRESAIVLSMTGGNQLMAIAAANGASRGCSLMYLELVDRDGARRQEYSVIGYDKRNHLCQTHFVAETPDILRRFNPAAVERCLGSSHSGGKKSGRRLP